jgi:dihydrofolate reductase
MSSSAPSFPEVALIAALAANRVIGDRGALPWRLPDEMKYFTRTTQGHTVIMGRKTFESIGKPLPRRRNLVVSRDPARRAEGVEFAPSLAAALGLCHDDTRVFVIGGTELYREAMPLASRLYLTEIQRSFDGDATFPVIPAAFVERSREINHAKDDPTLRFDFVVYEKV